MTAPYERAMIAKKKRRKKKKRRNPTDDAPKVTAGLTRVEQLPKAERLRQSISYKHGRPGTPRTKKGLGGITSKDIGLHGTSTSARGGGSLGTYWANR